MSEWKKTEIGLIPKDWQYVPFQSILSQPLRNGIYKQKEYHGRGTRVVNMGEMFAFDKLPNIEMSRIELSNDELEKSCVLEGDLLFARRSLVAEGAGKCTLVLKQEEALTFESSIIRARPDAQKADSAYLQYLFSSRIGKYLLKTILRQVAVSGITGADLARLKLPLPSLEEQKNSSRLLSSLDRKIDNLKRQNETLEEIARSIFKHWFIDFEFPNPDGKPYKSFGGAMVRSDLGDIPEGWRVRTLGDVATNNSETHKFECKNKIIFINTGDVLDGKFLHENYMSVNTLPGQAKKRIAKDDILYSEIRPKNKHFAYINFERNIENYVVSTKFMVVRANDSIFPRLLYLILKRQESIDEFNYIAESRSGTFPQITFEAVSHFQFPLPPIDIQQYLMPVFTNLMEKKEFNIIKIEILTKTRDALLPKLMSGQLRVND